MIGIKDQCFGCEIEMTGLSRARAAQAIAELFGTGCQHYGGYDAYHIIDHEGKEWKIVSDSSIEATARQGNRQRHIADSTYKVEMNSSAQQRKRLLHEKRVRTGTVEHGAGAA